MGPPCTHPARTVWLAGGGLRRAGRALALPGRLLEDAGWLLQRSVVWWR
jgi:hypothetical protein